jgi:hypothetical protein
VERHGAAIDRRHDQPKVPRSYGEHMRRLIADGDVGRTIRGRDGTIINVEQNPTTRHEPSRSVQGQRRGHAS